MNKSKFEEPTFPTAAEDVSAAQLNKLESSSERLAYYDHEFLLRDELRAVRLQLEWLKPDLVQDELGIESTVVIFGGARFPEPDKAEEKLKKAQALLANNEQDPKCIKQASIAKQVLRNSRFYEEARVLAQKITNVSMQYDGKHFVVVTGGGPGVMEAANRGAKDAGGRSIGLNIVLPYEQHINTYVTPELKFQFHYFAIRKMHFLKRAKALIACPGGFGTLDELFETLTLIQTKKIKPVPVILLGKEYWNTLVDFDFLVAQGAIEENDLNLFEIVDSAEEAWRILSNHWRIPAA